MRAENENPYLSYAILTCCAGASLMPGGEVPFSDCYPSDPIPGWLYHESPDKPRLSCPGTYSLHFLIELDHCASLALFINGREVPGTRVETGALCGSAVVVFSNAAPVGRLTLRADAMPNTKILSGKLVISLLEKR